MLLCGVVLLIRNKNINDHMVITQVFSCFQTEQQQPIDLLDIGNPDKGGRIEILYF